VEKTVKEVRDRKATGDGDVLGVVAYSSCWAKTVSNEWHSLTLILLTWRIW